MICQSYPHQVNSKNPQWPGLETARPASDHPPAGVRHAHATMAPGSTATTGAGENYGKIYGENQGFPMFSPENV